MENVSYSFSVMDLQCTVNLPKDFTFEKDIVTEPFSKYSNRVHEHIVFEIFFITDGNLQINPPTKQVFTKHTTVIVPPAHKHFSVFEQAKGVCMQVSVAAKKNTTTRVLFSQLASDIQSLPTSADTLCFLSCLEKVFMTNAAKAISLLQLIFIEIFQTFIQQDDDKHALFNYAISIDNYINQHLYENIKLADLANILSLSERQTSRIIQQHFHCSFPTLIQKRRLPIAASLLTRSDMSVSEIAQTIGYENENYFFTLFKKEYGITPLVYRKNHTMQPCENCITG